MLHTSLRRVFSLVSFCLIILFAFGLILFTKDVSAAAAGAVDMCLKVLVPSLLPFFVISSLFISTGAAERISGRLSGFTSKLLGLPGGCAAAIMMGLRGGYAVGARTAFDLYDRKICTPEEASRLLPVCTTCGPAYVFSAVGAALFGSVRAGTVIYICHILSAMACGMASVLLSGRRRQKATPRVTSPLRPVTSEMFTKAVTGAAAAMPGICGFVIFFSALTAFLSRCGLFDMICGLLGAFPAGLTRALSSGIIEMTGGVSSLSACGVPLPAAMAAAAFLVGWGGFSVHFQIMSLLGGRPISMRTYFISKSAQAVLCAAMTYAAAVRLWDGETVFYPIYANGYYIASPAYFIIIMALYLGTALLLSLLITFADRRAQRKK